MPRSHPPRTTTMDILTPTPMHSTIIPIAWSQSATMSHMAMATITTMIMITTTTITTMVMTTE